MDEIIASANKEVLAEMVKLAQKRRMSGSKGDWKQYLRANDKYGISVSDPSRKSVEVLAEFLKTFTGKEDLKFFEKLLQCKSNRDEVEHFKKASHDSETAEQRLVRLTLLHPQYPIDYSFPSFEEEWLIIKPKKKAKAMKSTAMIGIDCEMVLCEDGSEALVKVCAVDRDLQVKLNLVVKPNKAVVDYRTDITGITAADLDGETHSLIDVQESLKKLLSRGTILVGHSLNNDLQVLKLDHTRIIDTSYIFNCANGPTNKKPSLSLLCKSILGYELRKEGHPHNCLDDACAAMKLVLERLEGRTDGVIPKEAKELDVGKLFLHRIPISVLSKDLHGLLPGALSINAKVREKSRKTYSAFAIFKNQEEACKAFENLEGDLGEDSFGRTQKLVNFEVDLGTPVDLYVCKVSQNDSAGVLSSKKRSVEDEEASAVKKLRTDESEECSQCGTHLEEIERLKQQLKQREEEISSLNKIIAALARKQGL